MKQLTAEKTTIAKIPTQIEGLDIILEGGIPKNRVALLVGSAGSGKTIVGCEFVWRGIVAANEPAVFVTFEETAERITNNVSSFGWDFDALVADQKLAFVELNKCMLASEIVAGRFDLTIIVERISAAVKEVGATRVFIDSISAFFEQLGKNAPVRRMLFELSDRLGKLGVTTLLSAERNEEYGSLSAYRSEAFVSDCVIILRHLLTDEKTRRTVQVLKYRGSSHKQGEYAFTISHHGIVLMPTVAMELTSKSSNERTTSGNKDLDRMCGGGFFRDSIVLVSGPTGTGKPCSRVTSYTLPANGVRRPSSLPLRNHVSNSSETAPGGALT